MSAAAPRTVPTPVPSPCISVCTMGEDGLCDGCLRNIDEIARWGGMPDAEKLSVWRALRTRRQTPG